MQDLRQELTLTASREASAPPIPIIPVPISCCGLLSYEWGEHVSDAIADWVREGYARGPVDRSEVPDCAKIPERLVRVILKTELVT